VDDWRERCLAEGRQGELDRHGGRGRRGDAEAVGLKEDSAGLSGEEPEVCPVEEAARGVVEPAEEKGKPQRHVRHVRDRGEKAALGLDERVEEVENRPRVREVLQNVARDDDVEGFFIELFE
jgi:hypothetical protein